MEKALAHARANRERFVEQLSELLRIPSISTLPEHDGDCQRAAEWLAADLSRIGFKNVSVRPTSGHPVVYGEWLEAGGGAPTVLVYGHYDVQPVDPLELWESPPFAPAVRDGKIYARGATDDKGQVVMLLKAFECILAAHGSMPLNIKLILEGDEESNSTALEGFVLAHKELLAADSVLISDSGFVAPGRPTLTYGVRGIAAAEVVVAGPKTDLHSGGYGGTVRNPASALAAIIAALHDDEGRVRIPGFYDRVHALSPEERARFAAVPYSLEQWQAETGLQTPWGEPGYSLKERIGARPTCEVNGLWGGFQGEGGKTIIPAKAGAKFTLRLVPDQDPDEITRLFSEYVRQIAPKDLRVEVIPRAGCSPAVTPIDIPEIQAAARALETVWGAPPVFSRGGGSIPIVAAFQNDLRAPVVMLGFGLPDSGVHAPNEFFRLEQFHGGLETIIHYCFNVRALRGGEG
jgi:acetylornithine deacetylase/succinyl-diaminopimelate desuccinylase-like protein